LEELIVVIGRQLQEKLTPIFTNQSEYIYTYIYILYIYIYICAPPIYIYIIIIHIDPLHQAKIDMSSPSR